MTKKTQVKNTYTWCFLLTQAKHISKKQIGSKTTLEFQFKKNFPNGFSYCETLLRILC